MRTASLLRQAVITLWSQWGLRPSDFSKEELLPILMKLGAGLDLESLDKFLAGEQRSDAWATPAAREKRDELLRLRAYAFRAYAAGKVELALMTARLMLCEAQFIGWRVAVDPVVRTRKIINERNQRLAVTNDEVELYASEWAKYCRLGLKNPSENNFRKRMRVKHSINERRVRTIMEKNPERFPPSEQLRKSSN